ncbi:2og-Fe oxygenase family protein [Niveomyces insectorum RCEF 264]|uniref:2og-Fe oxygenase family protein n=1 Tax=Niveomyces insectorum RCEF 264 TaxID=1081102 RepID=A0A167XVV5_9HYPO|nr:2og-Fe oxygenase family protein [Niveomyces insectorum RCEF 264]
MDDVPPPARPPPLLAASDLAHLCTHGYIGLDLPPHLRAGYDRLLAAADAFFAWPLDAKLPYRPGGGPGRHLGPVCSPTNTERGYTHLPGEKEFLTLRRSMTHVPPVGGGTEDRPEQNGRDRELDRELDLDLAAAAAPVWRDTAHLLHRILADPGGGGAEPHRDLGLLTLCVCWGEGLQVRPRPVGDDPAVVGPVDPSSSPPPPPPPPVDATADTATGWVAAPRVTIMTGNTLSVLSSRRIPAALHRVVVDPTEAAAATTTTTTIPTAHDPPARRSIVFALRATTAGAIDLAAFGGYGTVEAQALYDGIRRQRVNINAGKETREAMRARFRKEKEEGSAGGVGEAAAATDAKGTASGKDGDCLDDGGREFVGVA